METPLKHKGGPKVRSPEWLAMRAKNRNYRYHQIEELKKRKKPTVDDLVVRQRKPKSHNLKRKNGTLHVSVPAVGANKNVLYDTGETTVGAALGVIDGLEIAKLSSLARGDNSTIPIILPPHRRHCPDVVNEWIADLAMDASASTVSCYRAGVRRLIQDLRCAKAPVASISKQNLYDWLNAPGRKESSMNLLRAAIQSFFKYAVAHGFAKNDISATLRVNVTQLSNTQRERVPAAPLTEEEYRKIVTHPEVPKFWRWATAMGYWIGLRFSDVCKFEWSSIREDSVVLYPHKTGRRLVIPLNDPLIGSGELKAVFDEMRAVLKQGGEYCFPEFKEYYPSLPFWIQPYTHYLGLCGIENKSFHGLRHSFRLRMTNSGRSIREVADLMGHVNPATTLGYGRDTQLKELYISTPINNQQFNH